MPHTELPTLIGLIQIILNLLGCQQPKLSICLTHHPNLNVVSVHLTLESFAKGQQCSMNGVFEFHVVLVAFFEETFGVDIVLDGQAKNPCGGDESNEDTAISKEK